jgi:hypothetical protein
MVNNLQEKKMSAEKSLKYLVREIETKLEMCDQALKEFATRLEKDADQAFEWGMNAMMYAANQKVCNQLLAHIKRLQENYPEPYDVLRIVHRGLRDEAINKARWPERSTSPTANIMSQERGMALAEWYSKVDVYITQE